MRSRRTPEARGRRACAKGFALLEIGVALLVLAVLASGLAVPLAAQVEMRRRGAAQRQLEEARDALMGFAAAQGRLPCPASAASAGQESFAPGGDATNGACSNYYDGFLPAATLGLAGLDDEGFARDPWNGPANRVRYAVFGGTVNGVASPLTRTDGMQAATLSGLGAASHYLIVCSTGVAASGAGCGPASRQLTRRAAFLVMSRGAGGSSTPPAGSDAARNLDGDEVFVAHEPGVRSGVAFDDIALWMPIHLVTHRLIVAGRLP